MRRIALTLLILNYVGIVLAQKELIVQFDKIKEAIENKEGEFYYPKLLKRFNDFDSTLTNYEYSLVYYGFSFQEQYMKNQPSEDSLRFFSKAGNYEKVIAESNKILEKNPVSLFANDKMGYALFKLGKPKTEWGKYQKRYRAIIKVIAYSGNGFSPETAFKVIYVSDEYNLIYNYFEIEEINEQSLIDFAYDKFSIAPSQYYKQKEIYFDISRKLIRQNELMNVE